MFGLLDSKYQRKMLKKWAPILESGKKIESETTKTALAMVLENTRNYYASRGMLMEAEPRGKHGGVSQRDVVGTRTNGVLTGDDSVPYRTGEYGDYYLPNVVMPILRRIFPDLIANELVGVQPLNGPIGFAMAYRPTYGQNGEFGEVTSLTSHDEIAFNPTYTSWTGAKGAAPDTHTDAWAAYAGNSNWTGVGADLSAAEWADIAHGTYPTVNFSLVKSSVEAKTRKLGAHWSPELAEDMQAMHGIDVEKEMINILSYEVGAEIDRQIITEMVKAAITGEAITTWTPLSADGLDQMGRLATLLTQITVEAQNIAIRTRRGNANFVVTSPRITALLEQLSMNKFTSFKAGASMPSVPDTGVGALTKVGLINNDSQLLIRDSYASGDYVLMGYKGKHPGDSGIIYCPYIPLQLAKVLQPGTFTPSVGARTRYGIMSNPWDAKNYYAFMQIKDLNGQYTWDGSRHFIGKDSPSEIKNGTIL